MPLKIKWAHLLDPLSQVSQLLTQLATLPWRTCKREIEEPEQRQNLKLKLKPFPSQKHVSAKQFSNYPSQLQLPIHPRRQNFGEFFTTKTPISESISMRPLLQYLRISCRTNISHVTASLAFFQRGFHSAPPVTVIVTMSTTTRPTEPAQHCCQLTSGQKLYTDSQNCGVEFLFFKHDGYFIPSPTSLDITFF